MKKKELTKLRYKAANTQDAEQERQRIIREGTGFHVREAYKAARTNIMFALAGKGCKKISITSASSGEGKSTTCLNIAITFTQIGARVIVVDADLRKPTLHRKLGMANGNGLSHLISGLCTLQEAINATEYKGLDIITAGHLPPNPAELLGSQQMEQLFVELEKQYDYIFLDTPPLNIVTDATILSSKVDGTIVIVRQEVTQHKELQEALGKLKFAEAKVLGAILHDVKSEKNRRYSKYTKYGYNPKGRGYEQYDTR